MNLFSTLHELKPLLVALLLPPAPLLILMLVGAGLLRRWRWAGRGLLTLGLVGAWLSCTEGTAQVLSGLLLQPPPALSSAAVADLRAENKQRGGVAVLVLGGGARRHAAEYAGPSLNEISNERLRFGLWLARRIEAPIGFTGGMGWNAKVMDESEAATATRMAAQEYGLPLKWAEGQSRDTRENASLSLALLGRDGVRKIVLVTHDLHMPRALRAFKEAAQGRFEIVAAPVAVHVDAPFEPGDWRPSNQGFARVRYVIYEWLGLRSGR